MLWDNYAELLRKIKRANASNLWENKIDKIKCTVNPWQRSRSESHQILIDCKPHDKTLKIKFFVIFSVFL